MGSVILQTMQLSELQIQVPLAELTALCEKWKVVSLAVFGSALTSEFTPTSDIDLLVLFQEGEAPSLFQLVQMRDEFQELFHRPVDLISRKAIENSSNAYRKEEILGTSKVIYEKEAA